jgi:hypothetical protein
LEIYIGAPKVTDTKHVHKLKRIKYKSGTVSLFCTLPDCTYKVNPALALGKRCICWRCEKEFLLNEYALRLAKPHCEACHKPKGDVTSNHPLHDEKGEFVITDVDHVNKEITLSLAERLKQTLNLTPAQEEEEI